MFFNKKSFLHIDSFEAVVEKEQMSLDLNRLGPKISLDSFESTFAFPDRLIEGRYLIVPFRALSETLVGKDSRKAADFTQPNVLKSSMSKLLGKAVYLNHSLYDVRQSVGVVDSVEWQEAQLDAEGRIIPAGINATLKIDAIDNGRIANALAMDMPSIYSSSVTIEYFYKPSHDMPDFRWYIGERDEQGRIICRQATEILDYHEISLVSLGADPFAKMIKNGTPHNIAWTSAPKAEEMPGAETIPSTPPISDTTRDYSANQAETIPSPESIVDTFSQQNPTTPPTETEDLVAQLSAKTSEIEKLQKEFEAEKAERLKLGEQITAETAKVENLTKELGEKQSKIGELEKNLNDLSQVEAEAEQLKTSLETTQTQLNQFIQARREECKRLHLLANKGVQDPKMITLIENSDLTALEALLVSFGGSMTESLDLRCSCGKKVDFRFSQTTPSAIPTKTVKKSAYDPNKKMFILEAKKK